MNLENDFIKTLIESPNTTEIICKKLLNIWQDSLTDDTENYLYKGEKETFLFEEFISNTYFEFYEKLLPESCQRNSLKIDNIDDDNGLVFLDGFSIREGVLLFNALKNLKYQVTLGYSFSVIPSDTLSFRDKLKKDNPGLKNFKEIKSADHINLSKNDRLIWSFFPDILLGNIQIGRTIISSIKNMYNTTEKIVNDIFEKIDAKKIIITSDHGYIRLDSGNAISVKQSQIEKLKNIFGSTRYISADKIDENQISEKEKEYITLFSDFYMVKSRYSWPVAGKYNIYQHGGISLMECITPLITIERE